MTVDTRFVWDTFGMVRPGDVFFYDGEFFLKLWPTDHDFKPISNNVVNFSGEARFLEDATEVFKCPHAHLSLEN